MSGAFIAIKIPLQIKIANKQIIMTQPIKPSSSATIEKIKSFCGSEIYKYFCLLSPNPAPNNPPEPIAYKLCITCHPAPCGSAHGSKNDKILVIRKLPSPLHPEVSLYTKMAPIPAPPTIPAAIKCNILAPAIINIMHVIIAIIKEALK